MTPGSRLKSVVFVALCPALGSRSRAQDYEQPPVSYCTSTPENEVSGLIYSPALDALPEEMRHYVPQRLWNVLGDGQDADKFAHLTAMDRERIVEVIRATKHELPEYWK